MIKKSVIFLILVFLTFHFSLFTSHASFSSKDKGTATAGFLKLGVGARAVSMGEAYSALADEASAMHWNVAGLRNIKSQSATFMHAMYIESSFFDYLAYGKRINDKSAYGVSLQYLSAGSIDETDETGTTIGTFNPNDMALTMGYARDFRNYSFGLGFKYIQSKIIDSATAFAFDFGILSPSYINNKLRLSFTGHNVGSKMKFEEEKEDLPMSFKLGSAYKLKDNWVSSLDIGFPKDNEPYFALGTEHLFPLQTWTLATRAGVNTRTLSDIDGFSGISFGVGFLYQKLMIDYGFLPFGSVGTSHRLSLSAKF
ncbi:PorV/PorQ family protein [Elusimicrobiota bacterium]